MKKVTDDVVALKPSIFAAVPRVLDRMKSGIEAKIKRQPRFKQAIFRVAYNIKRFTRRLGRLDFVSLTDPSPHVLQNAFCLIRWPTTIERSHTAWAALTV